MESTSRDRWHQGGQEVEGPLQEASSVVLAPDVGLGLGRGFELDLTIPWARVQARDEEGPAKITGFGDLLTRIYWNSSAGSLSFGLSAGAYLPIGNLGDQALPTTATFSSGTVDPAFGGYVAGEGPSGLNWQAAMNLRAVLGKNDENVKLGSTVTASLGVQRRVHGPLSAQLFATYLHREPDIAQAMMQHAGMREDSGGNWLYVQPSVTAVLHARRSYALQLTGGVRIPLIQNVVGTQLVESTAWNIGLAQTFRL